MKAAVVFAGGGSLGAVQVGMMKALVRPTLLWGASVGAINAAYYAAGVDEVGVSSLERIWLRLRGRDLFPSSALVGGLCLLGRRGHLVQRMRGDARVPSGPADHLLANASLDKARGRECQAGRSIPGA